MSIYYINADTIEEAVEILSDNNNAKILGGGQTLITEILKGGLVETPTIINLKKIESLKSFTYNKESLRIGSLLTISEMIDFISNYNHLNQWKRMLLLIGDTQIRNLATIGGSVALSDPSSDIWPLLLITEGTVLLKSKNYEKKVIASNWFDQNGRPVIKENELIVNIEMIPFDNIKSEKFFLNKIDKVTICSRIINSRTSKVAIGGLAKVHPFSINLYGKGDDQVQLLSNIINKLPQLSLYEKYSVKRIILQQISTFRERGFQSES